MTEEKRLEGQAALVTGAGSGIGRAIAVAFAREGARVGINYCRNEEGAARTLELVRGEGAEGTLVRADVSSAKEVAAMVRELETRWQGLEVLVNNSGIGTSASPDRVAEIDEADWDRVLDVNLKGTFLCIQAAAPVMLRQRSGRIINLASVVGMMGNAGQANYCASKAGVIGLTKSAARELAPRSVTVNAVAPGYIETDMTRHLSEKVKEEFLKIIPLARAGQSEDVAQAVLFLASDQAAYITGQVLGVNGGMYM